MRNTLKIAAATLTLAAAFPAMAQVAEGNWLIRARAVDLLFDNGQSKSVKTLDIKAEDRWIPEVDISYFFTRNIAAELVLTWPQNINIKAGSTKIGQIQALPPSLLIQYHFTDLGAFKPYVGAGVNYTHFYKTSNILDGAANIDKDSWGLVGQIGMDYVLNKNWSLNIDAKYVQMATDVHVGSANIGKLDLNPVTLGIGVGYRF
ncbi:MAG: OmpW family protein [Proteobacteria bacterium]|nr:OmpW family protein [Pseudomonadota bacterium]